MSIESFIQSSYRTKAQLLNPVNKKDVIRYDLALSVLEAHKGKKINILTLPSVWWNFEKLLIYLNEQYNLGVKIYFTACERENSLFPLVTDNMPRSKGVGIGIAWSFKKKLHFSSTDVAVVYNEDIFDYCKDNPTEKFDFVWLDLMCNINSMIYRLDDVKHITKRKSDLVVTFCRGRDGIETGMHNKIVTDKFNEIGYSFVDVTAYTDTYPMSQIRVKKIKN
jgi:hypothetical protein